MWSVVGGDDGGGGDENREEVTPQAVGDGDDGRRKGRRGGRGIEDERWLERGSGGMDNHSCNSWSREDEGNRRDNTTL